MKKQKIDLLDRYTKKKIQNKCTYCGKELNNDSPNLKCDICLIRSRVSNIDARLRRMEIFIDRYLKQKENI